MDTTDPDIVFDTDGVCNHCTYYQVLEQKYVIAVDKREEKLNALVKSIKDAGRGKAYDCLIGVSGGVDSTYVAYLVKKLGLRPLAVHLDNGWNSELSVSNIEKCLNKLKIDLFTKVLDWEEFRNLQLSFLKASVPDGEIPTDHAIGALLFKVAANHGIRHIISGSNIATEGMLPDKWTYGVSDWKYIRSVHRRFSSTPLNDYPHYSIAKMLYYGSIKRIISVRLLDYVDYKKDRTREILEGELGWKYYGGKHYESIYTRFFQGYILPRKFNIDKRRAHLSTLICSGQLTKTQALAHLERDIYDGAKSEDDRIYVIKKLDITEAEFQHIMDLPILNYMAYPNNRSFTNRLRKTYHLLRRLGLAPKRLGMG